VNIEELIVRSGVETTRTSGDLSVTVTDITHDSRAVTPGSLFCCVSGATRDGHDFAAGAVAVGATALVVNRHLDIDVAQLVVDDVREAMGRLAAAFHDDPSRSMIVVGVTGTNGKTTTTHLLAAILEGNGLRTGVIGTLSGTHTTPESPDLQRRLAAHRDDGCAAVVMEVSSHALELHRVAGCHFAVGVFTNLGRDHLDFHGTVERYFAAKAALFEPGLTERGVVNVDDVHGKLLFDSATIPMTGFGMDEISDLVVTPTSHSYTWRGETMVVAMGAHFNVSNSLAAATAASALGLAAGQIARGLAAAQPVPGRFEAVDAGQPFAVLVDYAHTPDGIEQVLSAARQVVDEGRVIVVFGCGGDRDREKRPQMGRVAARLADVVVLTSDNPRSEQPEQILASIVAGIDDDYRHALMVTDVDRRTAIAAALSAARPGDVVVIAGKGHETTQTIGHDIVAFDDRDVARDELAGLGWSSGRASDAEDIS
jgi:UDP-N-acetylmuramoyl-L-alanyl-D-glutamate--2,6-diaminopimelate ligase